MELNLLHFMWISFSFIVTFSGLNVLYLKENLPYIFVRLYSFGKVNKSLSKRNSVLKYLEIPKRYFSHFYIFASLFIPFVVAGVCHKYIWGSSSQFLIYLLDHFASKSRHGTVDAESVIVLGALLCLQVFRRCYECLFLSVYSDSKMNVLHYFVGFAFYFGAGLSLIHDAVGFEDAKQRVYISDQWWMWRHIIGTIIFLFGFILQYYTHRSFALLRKTTDGKVVSTAHYMPCGGFFEYVSCPHYFAEIVMYLSGCLILGGKSYTWWLLCLWVVTNQILTGLMSHQWYQQKFENYPPKRKAVIPFIV